MGARLLAGIEFDREALERAASDPHLQVTRKALEAARAGQSFRDAYRDAAKG